MKIYPLKSMNIEEAMNKQFELVSTINKHLKGSDSLNLGDLGVNKEHNMPITTYKVEKILADFFEAEDAILLRGAGTNAIRMALYSTLENCNKILLHDAPIYKTTEVNLKAMKLNIKKFNFNDISKLKEYIEKENIEVVLLQHTRQKLDDKYDLEEVIQKIKEINKNIKIIIDDNYAILKTHKNSIEMGADISAFSLFKLLGPIGIGLVIGKREIIQKIRNFNYSGGSQVQGYEAMEALRGLIYSPVMLAIQSKQIDDLKIILDNKFNFPFIKNTFIANAQSKVLLVEFKEDIAEEFLNKANECGALPNPVGAESKYDLMPLIYRISGTFLQKDPSLKYRMIRINPNKGGAINIAEIIKKAYYMCER